MIPRDDFALLLVILGMPLLGAVFSGVFGKRLGKSAVSLMALSAIFVSFLASLTSFLVLLSHSHGEEAQRLSWRGWEWLRLSLPQDAGSFTIDIAFSMDALSGVMSLVVTGVSFLIHLYSTKYMQHDEGYHRYFSYLNLFVFAMLVLVLGDNLPVLFIGWEGVGLCSYLLIGFWFTEDRNASAGRKAFVTNRIGDFGLLVAMGLLVVYLGGLDWHTVEASSSARLLSPVQVWPIGGGGSWAKIFEALSLHSAANWVSAPRYASPATLIALALFLGCAGKSAQLPLYVWLPDAMAGPTPVSALIHAATMVTAGVYLVCRMAPVFVLSPIAMFTVALVGAATAVFAATIAFVQKDIKKVLAYSTVSQLGYMFLGVGVGAFTAGFFHVLTHAFFKACLFLGAGSVIYAMHARIHDGDASQDMSYMGGLRRYLPVTFWTFVASWAAIVGLPGTSGFFSKDEILLQAFVSRIQLPAGQSTFVRAGQTVELLGWPSWGSTVLGVMGVMGAVMTAFYMTRLVIGIFFGSFRGWTIVQGTPGHDAKAHHGHEHGPVAGPALEGASPKESPWQMTVPLLILGTLAVFGGLLDAHPLGIHPLSDLLEPVLGRFRQVVVLPEAAKVAVEHRVLAAGFSAFAVGVGLAAYVFILKKGAPAQAFAVGFPRFYRLLRDKWRVDEFYRETVIGALEIVADIATWLDKWVVDGVLARLSVFCISAAGALLRLFQTGRVQSYAMLMVLGVSGIGWYLMHPHARMTVDADVVTGKYVVRAETGLGYRYRWDENGDKRFESSRFGETNRIEFDLLRDESRAVTLEVKGPTGAVARSTLVVERPKLDRSGGATQINMYQDAEGNPHLMPPSPAPSAENVGAAVERNMEIVDRLLETVRQRNAQ